MDNETWRRWLRSDCDDDAGGALWAKNYNAQVPIRACHVTQDCIIFQGQKAIIIRQVVGD